MSEDCLNKEHQSGCLVIILNKPNPAGLLLGLSIASIKANTNRFA